MTKVEEAQALLYGRDGLGVTNLKIFPGSNRDVTAEQMAEQIVRVARALRDPDGDIEIIA